MMATVYFKLDAFFKYIDQNVVILKSNFEMFV